MASLGRFRDIFLPYDVVEIVDYSQSGEIIGKYRGAKFMVAHAKDKDKRAVQPSGEHELGSDGWVKFWPLDEDSGHPDKLWLYQPRANLVERDEKLNW